MTFTLTIDCDNVGFEYGRNQEVARILLELATQIRNGDLNSGDSHKLFDYHGNTCGSASYIGED